MAMKRGKFMTSALLLLPAGVKVIFIYNSLALTSYIGSKSSHISLHLRNDAVVVFMGVYGVYGWIYVSMGVYGFLGIYGYLWVSSVSIRDAHDR